MIVCSLSFFLWWKNPNSKWVSMLNTERNKVSKTLGPLFSIVLMSMMIYWSCFLMLGVWSSAENVALFMTAMRTAMLISFVLSAVNSISAPKFASLYHQGDKEGLRKTALSSVRLMVIVAVPALMLMLMIPELIMSLFGEEFLIAAPLLQILAVGQFVNVISGSVGHLLQMTGHECLLRRNVFISGTVILIGGCIFIPIYGIYGAAWVTTVSIVIQNLLCVKDVKKALGFNSMAFWQKA